MIGPTGYLYKLKDGPDPVYARYAEGNPTDMIELANQLNYREAERNNELAVAAEPTEEIKDVVGIPTVPTDRTEAETTLLRIKTAIGHANSGRVNLVQTKRGIEKLLADYDESPRR